MKNKTITRTISPLLPLYLEDKNIPAFYYQVLNTNNTIELLFNTEDEQMESVFGIIKDSVKANYSYLSLYGSALCQQVPLLNKELFLILIVKSLA